MPNRFNTVEEYVEDLTEVKLSHAWKHNFPNVVTTGFILTWAANSLGFGEATFYVKDNTAYCDDECMSPQFIEAVLIKYARSLTLTHK